MTRLDDLKGLLSIRAINCLKMRGYEYLEQVDNEAIRRVTGKKTKQEILNFIKTWNSIDDNGKIFQMKQADIEYDVEMYKVWDKEYISDNGRWSVTKNGIYFNYKDASYPIGEMENVPDAVQKVYEQLKEAE